MPLEADSRVDAVLGATFFFCMIGLIGLLLFEDCEVQDALKLLLHRGGESSVGG